MTQIVLALVVATSVISCQKPSPIENIVVIGGGLMGSSTAWELSKYGENVLLLEQQDSVYTFGSSFGEARISRSLGPQNDVFSYLQQTSVRETLELIDYLNSFGQRHSMDDIYSTSPVTYIYYQSQLEEVEALLDHQTDKYQFASNPKEALEMFDMVIADTAMVIREFKKYSGTLNPKVLISKLHEGITKAGNRVRYNAKVTSLTKVGPTYEIEVTNTDTGKSERIKCKKVVAAAGPFNGMLVKDIAPYFAKLITPKRLFLSFLRIKENTYENFSDDEKRKLIESYPVANLNSEIFYSMIEKFDEHGMPLIKVGGHFLRTDIDDLSKVWEKELTSGEIEWSKENTFNYLNTLNLPVSMTDLEFNSGYSCVYSLTESETPYVTNIIYGSEIDPNFILVGGMSGIGAKGSLAYGLIGANLLLNKSDTSRMYQLTREALGSNRLMNDISDINRD